MKPRPASGPERAALAALLLAGAILRLWQYFANTSLWIDELGLAENVIRTPLVPLLHQPLVFDQVASPGFLAALKLLTSAFGPNEYALRLFPLLSALVSLPLFALLAVRTRPGWTSVFAVGLFALYPALISHGAEAKQYSTDVCVSIALTLVARGLRTGPQKTSRYLSAGLAGAAAVWFSHTAVFMVAGLGAALAFLARRDRQPGLNARLALPLGLWAASAAAATAFGLQNLTTSTREYMRHFWEPSLPRPAVLILLLLTFTVLWKTRASAAPLLVGPAVLALVAAAAHLYPFSGRAILFLTPAAMLAAADGAGWIVSGIAALGIPQPAGAALFAVPLAVAFVLHPPVYRNEETRPVLASVAAARQPGDALYVYYGAERAVRFYGPRVGVEPSEATFGACHRGEPREYLRELDQFRGRPRVWIVFAHSRAAEQAAMSAYLARIGRRRAAFPAAGASAELYDLSEAALLQAATAETYPLPEGDPEFGGRYGCGHGPIAETPADWK